MKGTPEAPACGFSARTVAALQSLDAPFAAVDILPDPRIRQELSALSNWPTIPQLFVDGELVGGCDIVTEMYESGELAEALGVEPPAGTPEAAPAGRRGQPRRCRSRTAWPSRTGRPAALRCGHGRPRHAHARAALGRAQPRAARPDAAAGARGMDRPSHGAHDTAAAIRRLAVRGAPNIGIAGAYGLAMAVAADPTRLDAEARALLRTARPTAVNLPGPSTACAPRRSARPATAARRARGRGAPRRGGRGERARSAGSRRRRARRAGARRVLTHCNTGALASAGRGHRAGRARSSCADRGAGVEVLACETRPLLQGARLTVWELERARHPPRAGRRRRRGGAHRAAGEVDAVVVGCDRVAANGDVANKVGTYAHALAARGGGHPVRRRRRRPRRSTPRWPTATRSRSRSATPTRSAARRAASC